MKKYANHLILLAGTNLTGILNFTIAIIVFKIASSGEYSKFIAYLSYFAILSSIPLIIKRLSTTYGIHFLNYLRQIGVFSRKSVFMALPVLLLVISIITITTQGHYLSSLFLVATIILNIFTLLFVGLWQHNSKFGKTTIILFIQNLLKLILVVPLLLWFGNNGIWFAYFVVSLAFLIWLIKNTNLENSGQIIKLSGYDIFLNLMLFVSLEVLFNLDGIIVQTRLSGEDAVLYNSIILVKKGLLVSIVSIVPILLSKARKSLNTNYINLFQNLLITIFVGLGISIPMYIGKDYIFQFLQVGDISQDFLKLIVATVVFGLVMITTYWFTSFESKLPRILAILGIITAVIFYTLSISTFENAISIFLNISIVLAIYKLIIVISAKALKFK
jgi:hypothetical protein